MMIVDLIDEVDFKEKLVAAGIPIEVSSPLSEIVPQIVVWIQQSAAQAQCVQALCIALESSGFTLLPEVDDAIKTLQKTASSPLVS